MQLSWFLTRLFLALVVLSLPGAGLAQVAAAGADPPAADRVQPANGGVQPANITGWRTLAPGIDYAEFHLSTPNNIFVARMQRSNPRVTLETTIAQDNLVEGRETVRSMAQRYNDRLTYWGYNDGPPAWGSRSRVVVAINGYFFDDDGTPWSGVVQSGWYAQRFWDLQSVSGFAWTLNRGAFVGECIFYKSDRQTVTINGGEPIKFQGINVPREADELVIYTPQYAANTGTTDDGLEVLVQLSRPLLILPSPASVSGVVTDVRDRKGSSQIPFDHIVLSASGNSREKLLPQLQTGAKVNISQQIDDCPNSPSGNDWTKTYTGIGADYYFLKDGVYQPTDNTDHNWRTARTALAFNDEYLFFIVVDGKNPGVSLGMSMQELANFSLNELQAVQGVSLDGGGSSTMVVNGKVVNNTYCNYNDCSDGLDGDLVEPVVATGLLMVEVEPPLRSEQFPVGSLLALPAGTQVRAGPGDHYPLVTMLTAAESATVIEHPTHLNGIQAKGRFWWYLDFNDTPPGWVAAASDLPRPERLYLAQVFGPRKTTAAARPANSSLQDLYDLMPLAPLSLAPAPAP